MKTYGLTFSYEVEDVGGRNEGFTVDVHVTFVAYTDSSYGADADGNRGISMDFVEDVDFKIMWQNINLTELFEKQLPTAFKEIEQQAEQEADEYDWQEKEQDDYDSYMEAKADEEREEQ